MMYFKRFAVTVAAASAMWAAASAQASSVTISTVDNYLAGSVAVTQNGTPSGDRFDLDNVKGAMDGKYYSLNGGWILVEFGTPTTQFTGPAYAVEFTNGKSETAVATGTTEKAAVYVSASKTALLSYANSGFTATVPGVTSVGTALGSGTSTLNFSGNFQYMLIRDTSTPSEIASTYGFEVDSVKVTSVPVPASVSAGAGLLGLLGAAKFRKRLAR